jgi:hypothetical protein
MFDEETSDQEGTASEADGEDTPADSTDEGEIGGSAETPEPARIPSDDEREAEGDDEEDDSSSAGGPDDTPADDSDDSPDETGSDDDSDEDDSDE